MKAIRFVTIIVASLLFYTDGIQAQTTQIQPKQICLENAEQFSITSKYVEGETYLIQVAFPMDYSASKKSYPVLYVTDGDTQFGMARGIAIEGWMGLGNNIYIFIYRSWD